MIRLNRTLLCALIAFSVFAVRAYADDKGPNTTKEAVKPTDKPTSVQTLKVAGDLAAWARSNHDPVGLAVARR